MKQPLSTTLGSRALNGSLFGLFRILFGSYLLWHFTSLLPYAEELFGYQTFFSHQHPSPYQGIWPNPLFFASSGVATGLIAIGSLASIFIISGRLRRSSALYLWLLSSWLFTANPLIANPSLGYTGLLLALFTIIPLGENFVLRKTPQPHWKLPAMIPVTAWSLLALGYTFSGIMKLDSPSWVDGSALQFVLENPLARPNLLRGVLLSLPEPLLKLLTWSTLSLEILFLPLVLVRKFRPWVWLATLLMHLSIMLVIDFTDLSLGMLMIHLFTYQPCWLPARAGQHILFIDGECALCHQSSQLLIRLDPAHALSFSTLQGATARLHKIGSTDHEIKATTDAAILLEDVDSDNPTRWEGPDAILRALYLTGGLSSLLWPLHLLPDKWKQRTYQAIASRRHRISQVCPIPSPSNRQQFLP